MAAIPTGKSSRFTASKLTDADPKTVKKMFKALHQKELIESGQNGPMLTAKGQIVVNHYLERVNA